MIKFFNKKYELYFSNNFPPRLALNYADELFFSEFEKLCGKRYRILSVIKGGWQEKYILYKDLEDLKIQFEKKINDNDWADELLRIYEKGSKEFRQLLNTSKDPKEIRQKSALLDAMSNMLYLFSCLAGSEFLWRLKKYGEENISNNFIYYTQPIKESRHAKILIKDFPKEIKLNQEDVNFSKILRLGAYVKDDVSELLEKRERAMNLKKDMDYLTLSEIGDHKAELVDKRKELTILFYKNRRLNILEGNDAKIFLKEGKFEILKTKKKKILKGEPASFGKYVGRVKVARTSREAEKKINKGDILIARYTEVDYLPAMKKAGAVVTETGGITSHAAIISRELKIPCIIALKNATKNFKDNEIVEVDVDGGIVKKL